MRIYTDRELIPALLLFAGNSIRASYNYTEKSREISESENNQL